jgi:hypothetical protein
VELVLATVGDNNSFVLESLFIIMLNLVSLSVIVSFVHQRFGTIQYLDIIPADLGIVHFS